jgi:hypothetical protein
MISCLHCIKLHLQSDLPIGDVFRSLDLIRTLEAFADSSFEASIRRERAILITGLLIIRLPCKASFFFWLYTVASEGSFCFSGYSRSYISSLSCDA